MSAPAPAPGSSSSRSFVSVSLAFRSKLRSVCGRISSFNLRIIPIRHTLMFSADLFQHLVSRVRSVQHSWEICRRRCINQEAAAHTFNANTHKHIDTHVVPVRTGITLHLQTQTHAARHKLITVRQFTRARPRPQQPKHKTTCRISLHKPPPCVCLCV